MSFHLVDAALMLPIMRGDKATLVALASFADPDGTNAHPGLDKLRVRTSGSKRFIQNHLEGLSTLGLISRVGGGLGRGNASEYEIDAELVYKLARANGWQDTRKKGVRRATFEVEKSGTRRPEKVHMTTGKGARGATHSVIDSVSDSVGRDFVGDPEAAVVGDRRDVTPTLAGRHPRQDGETLDSYLARLSNLHEEEVTS